MAGWTFDIIKAFASLTQSPDKQKQSVLEREMLASLTTQSEASGVALLALFSDSSVTISNPALATCL